METDDAEIKRSIVELLQRNIQEHNEFWSKTIQQSFFSDPPKEIIEGDGDGKSTREDA